MEKKFQFSDSAAYPPVQVRDQNTLYAKAMLTNMGSCNSEMSAVSLYFYNSIICKECFPKVSECFHKIAIVEMHHLDIFGHLALLSGADPRLWSYYQRRPVYWSPKCNNYPRELPVLLENAIANEKKTIEQYKQQMRWIEDSCIIENLKRIILDEEHHVGIFQELYQEFCL